MRTFAIIPAAGLSRRMGRSKLSLPWRGKGCLLEVTLRAWASSRVDTIVLVARSSDEETRTLCERERAILVVPDPAPPEMKDSIVAGLRYLMVHERPGPEDIWLVAPADMPNISSTLIDRLLAAHERDSPAIVQPTAFGKRGHPVLFPWPLAAEVELLGPDEGLNVLTRRHPVRELPCADRSIFEDVDTPRDYRELHGDPLDDPCDSDGPG